MLLARRARGRSAPASARAARRSGVFVLVDLLEACLVDVRMGVRVAVVRVLVLVLDVLVVMVGVRVHVGLAVVLVLVRMRRVVLMLFGHGAPSFVA
jgi:hypothetical protein